MKNIKRILASVWLFPIILTVALGVLTVLRIHGSSLGVYHQYFYGATEDAALLVGEPRPIRSDEWVVNTQMIIAQKTNNYERINDNIGNGQDMSVILDVPYKEWSQLFRPHNLAFFVLPFENAFALKWWLMGYLLMISCYFFVITILPNRRFLAAGISVALFFSPFIQWWYQYITIAPLYYCLFMATLIIHLLRSSNRRKSYLIGIALSYLAVCFALVLYPPFQIPCALALLALSIGFAIEELSQLPRREVVEKLAIAGGAAFIAALCVGAFILTRSDVVQTIANTAYPGHRITSSGNYDLGHLLSGHLAAQQQSNELASKYYVPELGVTNQSEASSFFFLWPFLILPCLILVVKLYRNEGKLDWPLLCVIGLMALLLMWLFVPHLGIVGKIFQLERVPHNRLIIGFGLLNVFLLTLFVRRFETMPKALGRSWKIILYCVLLLLTYLFFDFNMKERFPGYLGTYRAIAYALPAPVIAYLLLSRRYKLAVTGLVAFSLFLGASVNPLYRGTAVLTQAALTPYIQTAAQVSPESKWVIEDGNMENLAIMAGVPSLSGIYTYPQLNLWESIDKTGRQEALYNRYAHVSINLDRDPATQVPTQFIAPTFDHFGVKTEVCSSYLESVGVRYALTEVPLPASDTCAKLIDSFKYPSVPFYIYILN